MADKRIDWYRTKIDRETFKALTTRSDVHGLAQAGSQLLIFIATACWSWYAWHQMHWGWFVVALFVHGTFAQFLGIGAACHELSHGTPFKTKWLSTFFYSLFSFLSWNNPVWFRVSHKHHHQFTLNYPSDQEVVLPRTLSVWQFVRSFVWDPTLLWMSIPRHIQHAMGVISTPWERKIFDENSDQRGGLFAWARILVLGHLALAIWFAVAGEWILIPILLLPVYGGWLSVLCGGPQHMGLQSNVKDFRKCCRTVVQDPITAYLYWQMNYHIEHHMFPGVPFFNLRKLHKILQADGAPQPNRGLWDAWREIRMIQRQQRETPDVAFDTSSRGKVPIFVGRSGPLDGVLPKAKERLR